MIERAGITIDIVSDVMCPWCYIGQKRLEKAIGTVPDIDVDIRWRPFQLDPSLPAGGKDRSQYLREKFGGAEKARAVYDRIAEAGRAEGIAFDFDAISVSPNTVDAHRVLRWADQSGDGVQNRLARRFFQLYFEEGANLTDATVLVGAAAEAGMDPAIVETLLPTDADRAEVQAEIATAQEMGVTGVPCFLIEGRYAIMGAQDSAVLADAIVKISEAKARGELEPAG